MAVLLSPPARALGTYGVTFEFFEVGEAVVPTSLSYSLFDGAGEVVNDRENVAIASPSATTTIVLAGDDLAVVAGSEDSRVRTLVVSGLYNSALGNNLPLKEGARFDIEEVM